MRLLSTALGAKSPQMITKDDLGWVKVAQGASTYGEWKSNDYENAYPSITKINNKFMVIRPYAVDGEGNKVEAQSPVINALYHPNKLNSSVEFREALSLMYLVHPKTHILVWRRDGARIFPGGNITPQNIGGFTFLENATVITVGGKTTYTINSGTGSQTYSDNEVITLGGLNPYHINSGGFSATQAACKWTAIDDYIAQYQKGFFRNGAVPSGEFVITASTKQEFNDIVDKMQEKHRGADRNGNIVYTHRPVDRATGKPVEAQIEWIPYSVSNRELSLKDLFEQANKKIDSAYGVPASIRGVGENNNYATARTDQQNFMENVVDPIALKIWTSFTHELNRITGGLGVGISYDIDIPALADEELVAEQRDQIRDERAQAWLDRGYSLTSVKAYLDNGDLNELEMTEVTESEEDNPDIDNGNEVKNSPDPKNPTSEAAKRTNPKAQSPDPSIDNELVPYEQDIQSALNAQIERQINRASASVSDSVQDATDEENNDLSDEIGTILLSLMLMRGSKMYNDGIAMALSQSIDISTTSKFAYIWNEADKSRMSDIVKSFNEDTSGEITKVLAAAIASGATNVEIKRQLSDLKAQQSSRIYRFAGNESWRASELAGLQAMNQLSAEINTITQAAVYKTWNVQASACAICMDYSGSTVKVSEKFSGDVDAPPLHVSCRCMLSYSITKGAKAQMEYHCSVCGRFEGYTEKTYTTDKLKCGNSDCKALEVPKILSLTQPLHNKK